MLDKSKDDGGLRRTDEDASAEEADLDEALMETFPASDPVSISPKIEPTRPAKDEENNRNQPADGGKRH